MADKLKELHRDDSSPAYDAEAVTPNDSSDLSYLARALYIGVDGDVSLITKEGTTVTFTGLLAGSILPVACSRVMSTNTTATGIVALY